MIRLITTKRGVTVPTEISEPLLITIKEDLKRHEGVVPHVYLDSEGYYTFGIGHLIRSDDPESVLEEGDPVSDVRITQVFAEDLQSAIADCEALFIRNTQQSLYSYPESVQRVMINMTFNLGSTRLNKFVKLWAALARRDYSAASKEMIDSKWYRQVKGRGRELARIMEWTESD